MQTIGTGSSKEDIVAKLIRTALFIGLAVTVHPGAAAEQYSWSNFSVSMGFRTGGVGWGFGSSYPSVDPWYDYAYTDPCWDYGYYERYWYDCPFDFKRIRRRSFVSVDYRYPYRPPYYRPCGYYGYSGYTMRRRTGLGRPPPSKGARSARIKKAVGSPLDQRPTPLALAALDAALEWRVVNCAPRCSLKAEARGASTPVEVHSHHR